MRISPLILSLSVTFSYGFRSSGRNVARVSAFFTKQHTTRGVNYNIPRYNFATRNLVSYSMKENTDVEYPGTAVERMMAVRARVAELANGDDLNQDWGDVRRKLLWAGGLKDLPEAVPGKGYTGHAFNDYNHVDLTCMMPVDNTNGGEVNGIAIGNALGDGIRIASLPELGPGGSWSTCITGCNQDPPQDVAHVQFQSRIAFKLVWVPNKEFNTFVLVDDDGKLLAKGMPTGTLPPLRERQINYKVVAGSRYAKEAEAIAAVE